MASIFWVILLVLTCILVPGAGGEYNCTDAETKCAVINAKECKDAYARAKGEPIPNLDPATFLRLTVEQPFPGNNSRVLVLDLSLAHMTETTGHILIWLTTSIDNNVWSLCFMVSLPVPSQFDQRKDRLTIRMVTYQDQGSYQLLFLQSGNVPSIGYQGVQYSISLSNTDTPKECSLSTTAFTTTTTKATLSITVPSRHNDLVRYYWTLVKCRLLDYYHEEGHQTDHDGQKTEEWWMDNCLETDYNPPEDSYLKGDPNVRYQIKFFCYVMNQKTHRFRPTVTLRSPTFTVQGGNNSAIVVRWREPQVFQRGTSNGWPYTTLVFDHIRDDQRPDNGVEENDNLIIIAACLSSSVIASLAGILVFWKWRQHLKKKSKNSDSRCDVIEIVPTPSQTPTRTDHQNTVRGQERLKRSPYSQLKSSANQTPPLNYRKTSMDASTDGSDWSMCEHSVAGDMDSDTFSFNQSPSLKPLNSFVNLTDPLYTSMLPPDFKNNIGSLFYENGVLDKTDRSVYNERANGGLEGLNELVDDSSSNNDNPSSGYYSSDLPPLKAPRAMLRHEGSMGSSLFNALLGQNNSLWNVFHLHSQDVDRRDECRSIISDSGSL